MQEAPEASVVWVRADSRELEPWRRAVGPPVVLPPRARGEAADELGFAVWNTGVGSGDLERFVADLRAGRLFEDRRPTEHVVLLLQEVYRAGESVPLRALSGARGARRIHRRPRTGARLSIDTVARRSGLALYYVPSMRNGRPRGDAPREDRGNAILSTLPLSAWTAIELPFERERRVALQAHVSLSAPAGGPRELRFVNVHLDPRSSLWRAHRSLGAGRAHQALWLASLMDDAHPTVVGGDLNTWAGGRRERAVAQLGARIPEARPSRATGTRPVLRGLAALELDHVFVQAPWRAEHRVLDDDYGSDHRPLVGRLTLR